MVPSNLERIIAAKGELLARRAMEYARERGLDSHCTAASEEVWRLAIAGLSQALLLDFSALDERAGRTSGPGRPADPATAFGAEEARRQRARGEPPGSSLEIMKCSRQSYLDLVREQRLPAGEEEASLTFVERFFDRVETGVCVECASLTNRASAELASANALLEREIEQHRKTEEALVRSERLFHAAIDALTANIAILDCNGTIMAVNRAWRQFADENGFRGENYGIGSSYLAVCDSATGDDAEVARAAARGIRDLLAGRSAALHLEYQCHSPDEKRWFQMRATCLEWLEPACVVMAHESITEVKRAEQEMVSFNRALEERVRHRTTQLELSNRELEGFCYAVSHDLRAHLARLEGFGRGLLEDFGERFDGPSRSYVERICRISIDLRRVIDALLDLSRYTRCDLVVRPVNLSDIASAVADELHAVQPRRSVKVDIAPDVIVKGDPKLLAMVVRHLLENAWKFTSQRTCADIQFGVTTLHGMRACFVRDNGAGFDMRYAGRLFQPFQRLHGPAEFEGLGIGLATVQRIVQRHGGRAWAEGEVDGGATFYFTLQE
ncbi:MAG: PAS domain-containing sensor histidine kinase [Desulfuromonadales bacterium]|nr:MAG: PAS domain-containing sensor histidine kinase [Desulfuromonadales bacterium]